MSTAPTAFIDDGYEEHGYIREQPRLHPAVRFLFRPMLGRKRKMLSAENNGLTPDEQLTRTVLAVTDHIISWDLKDRKDKPIPKTAEGFEKLKPALQDRLQMIVMGLDASDAAPEQKPTPEQIQQKVDAATTGQPIGDVKAESDLKN